jgi:hypothetical protein
MRAFESRLRAFAAATLLVLPLAATVAGQTEPAEPPLPSEPSDATAEAEEDETSEEAESVATETAGRGRSLGGARGPQS